MTYGLPMKTIILTSKYDQIATDELDEFLPKPLKESTILCVTTALNETSDLAYKEQQKQIISKLNHFTQYDIKSKTKGELKKALSQMDIVYVTGGSTFYLLKYARESGFAEALTELLPKGLIYIGHSAGAYIACPSIIMKTWAKRPSNQCGITDLTAMNLVPFLVKAHYKPEMKEMLEEKTKGLPYPLRVLNDNQALLIRDEEVRLLGGGEEIIIRSDKRQREIKFTANNF